MNYIIYINVKKQHGKDGFINALAVLRDYIASLTKKINWSQYYWSKIGVVNQLHMGNLDVIRFVRLWVGKNSLRTHTPANISLFKVNKRYTRKNCEICSKLITKTPEWRHWRRSGVFIVNFEHISHLFLVYLLLTLNMEMLAGTVLNPLELHCESKGGRRGGPNKRGDGGLKNVLGQKWQLFITNYECPKQNVFAPYLNIVDTGATTLNKIRKANQSHFTITQSRNIQRYVFETSLI